MWKKRNKEMRILNSTSKKKISTLTSAIAM